ncbi:BZ3500_MvSof-1268-A1-R1_Chr2-2g04802 [Microbotryum saponariae]|uniref:ATP-dependent DNA helicase PIF1 n=1 Tax=Microbotryum saponariae TaxID=289078 RepID=A0A2X0KA56_9BASI|nr:BZ3500_MvSof-1268-A1-R1_Chr2-2g04802 [Microbotryum saponariae]SDA00198.1 BZ3501_MvSof-1269-A2-R1_Chr2-2g04476 [Microbotryum saponariae]
MGMLSSQPKRHYEDDDAASSHFDDDIENEAPRSTFFQLDSQEWPPTPPKPNKLSKHMNPQLASNRPAAVPSLVASSSRIGAANKNAELNRVTSTSRDEATSYGGVQRTTSSTSHPSTSSRSANPVAKSTATTLSRTTSSTTQPFRPPALKQPVARTSSSSSVANNASTSRTTSAAQQPPRPTTNTLYNAGFTRPSSSSTLKPTTSSTSVNSTTSNTSASSTVPKKRVMPWDLPSSASLSKAVKLANGTSAFQVIGDGKLTRVGLADSTMDIKQKILLSPEQQIVHKLVVDEGKSVFFTGSAGTGKSVLLREIIASLKRKYVSTQDAVAITASTGMAACNIGGTTIHSFAGIGLGLEAPDQLVRKVQKNKTARGRWQRLKVLLIDEVSMVDGDLFDKLAYIAEGLRIKGKGKPFGGIQLVVTGDFLQLPPVAKGVPTFAFEAKEWNRCIHHTVNLTQVFRQSDTRFIDMLNEMRFGTLSAKSIAIFKSLSRDPKYTDGIDPTELYPRREEVDRSNVFRLNALPGAAIEYRSEDWPSLNAAPANGNGGPPYANHSSAKTILNNFMAPPKLTLKVGAQVMLIKNLDSILVNGTIGRVVEFSFAELEKEVDLDGEDGSKIKMEQERKLNKLIADAAAGKAEKLPRVEWRVPGGQTFSRLMAREEFKVEDVGGQKVASRKQLPLILAWAMSIHKSQGQTLPRVKVDLNKVFESGQSYVALSRATDLDGLQVLGFNESKVRAHEKVIAWSKNLEVLR